VAPQGRQVEQEAGRAVRRPRCRIVYRPAGALEDIVNDEGGAAPQDAGDFAVEPRLVRDVHRHVLRVGGGEARRLERQRQGVGRLEPHPVRQAAPARQLARDFHVLGRQVDADDAIAPRRQKARWAAEAAADVEQLRVDGRWQ
jgi:hypothetical protein